MPVHECTQAINSNGQIKGTKPLDVTQRIEKKIAEFNASENIAKRWLFELICWMTSSVSLGSIIAIYVHISNKRLVDQGTLLTLANILGKVASAALIVPTTEALGQLKWNWFHDTSKAMWDFEIFDKATRGPWGAAMLLYRTKGRSLAALGALLIVLLLAIDAFLQQVVDLPDRWALQTGITGSLSRIVRYEPGTNMVLRFGDVIASDSPDLFPITRKFAYGNGTEPLLFGNGTRPEIPVVSFEKDNRTSSLILTMTSRVRRATAHGPPMRLSVFAVDVPTSQVISRSHASAAKSIGRPQLEADMG